MATTSADVIRIHDDESVVQATILNQQWGFGEDSNKLVIKKKDSSFRTITDDAGQMLLTGNQTVSGTNSNFNTTINVSANANIEGDINANGDINIPINQKIKFGTTSAATIKFDGNNMIIDPDEIGTGKLFVNGKIDSTDINTFNDVFRTPFGVFTANTSQSAGFAPLDGVMLAIVNVNNANDVVTLPDLNVYARGSSVSPETVVGPLICIYNGSGVNNLQIFPASGQSIVGVAPDTSITLTPGNFFVSFATNVTWYRFV